MELLRFQCGQSLCVWKMIVFAGMSLWHTLLEGVHLPVSSSVARCDTNFI